MIYLNFKEFLEVNYGLWGNSFRQEPEMINGPEYRERGVNSRYKGNGFRDRYFKLPINRMYGFDKKKRINIDWSKK